MELIKNYVIKNIHYINNKQIQVKGLVLHSIGTPQPDPKVIARLWNSSTVKYLAQIVIGADEAYEVLPCTNIKGYSTLCYHVGSANNYTIGAEMTEPSTIKYTSGANWVDLDPDKTKEHVLKTYENAVDIFAQLCFVHDLDPLKDGVILSHKECNARGIGTNHADVDHLWSKFGLTMDKFRQDVNSKLNNKQPTKTSKNESVITERKEETSTYDLIKEGSIYKFFGNKQYASANSDSAVPVKSSNVKIIQKYFKNSKHPILARSVDKTGNIVSGIYGWIDITDIKESSIEQQEEYKVKITSDALNVRSGPGVVYKVVDTITDKGVYTIVETKSNWGRLKSNIGWISLKYTQKLT